MPKDGSEQSGPTIAVIAGSGMEGLFGAGSKRTVRTAHGSVKLYRCETEGRAFIYLPRHGEGHSIPPHRINFRANLRALKDSGVRRVIATSAVGTMTKRFRVGQAGLPSQFIDLSKRHLTFFDRRPVHVDMSRPYDRVLQRLLLRAATSTGLELKEDLVYVSVDGPRYETAAEIRAFRVLGGDVVGMTGAPEAILSNELGLAYASVVVATNWAAGLQEKISHEEVVSVMGRTGPRIKDLVELAVRDS